MKRMITMAAALSLVAGFTLAQTSVESQNIVGYQNIEAVGPTFNMLAVNWEAVGGGELGVQEIFADPLGAGLTGGTGAENADRIQVWNPTTSGYKTYWLADTGGAYPEFDGKWFDATSGTVTTDTLPKGSSFWLRLRGSTVTNVVMGQVATNATVDHTLVAGTFTMIASAYAADILLNDGVDVLASGAVGGTGAENADRIQVWNPTTSGYKTYWLADTGGAYPEFDGKWFDATSGTVTTDVIPLGSGAWYRSRAAADVTWTESKPY